MTLETDDMIKKWDCEFDKIEEDYDKFSKYFDKHRRCNCKDVNDCKHFDRALKIFDKKLDDLDDLDLKIFGQVYNEVIKPALIESEKN